MICKFCNKETAIIKIGLEPKENKKVLHVHELTCYWSSEEDEHRAPVCLKCLKIKVMMNELSAKDEVHCEVCFREKHGDNIFKFIEGLGSK